MIEALSKVAELGAKGLEGGAKGMDKTIDPNKRVEVGKVNANGAEKFIDPNKRVEVGKVNADGVVRGIDPNKRVGETNEVAKKGGSYAEVKKYSNGDFTEVHHMPSASASDLPYNDGPAIKMDKADHRETASYGSSNDARGYSKRQKELIDEGKFREAMQMDIDDIHDKFGNKYDDAIAEAKEYADKLEKEGRI